MNHLSVSTTADMHVFLANEPSAQIKRTGIRLKKRVILVVIAIIMFIAVTPSLLAWAGNMWIDDDKLAAISHPADRSFVKLDQMPDYVWQSFVSIEDHRYMLHHGVDPISMARAVWIDLQAGSYVQGGSTITMQLARNLFLTQDKTMLRKVKEMAIALQLEQRYSKKELLEMYLNVIYFGHGRYGINDASELYFDKSASDITLGEAAILASLPKGPEVYSPLKHWDKAKSRQHVVLERMAELGVISQDEYKLAEKEEVSVVRSSQLAS